MRIVLALLKLGVLVIALLAVAAGSAYVTIRVVTGKESVVVPDVAGLSITDASRLLGEAGLGMQIEPDERSTFHDSIPYDHVLSQTPEAGGILKRDRKVRVVRSLGSREVYVPRVVGEVVNAAQMRIHDAGLRLGDVVYVESMVVPDNVIVDQEPSRLSSSGDDRVNLLVSSGATKTAYVMPDVTARQERLVRAMFERRGFRVRVESEAYSEQAPDGWIVRTKPLQGYLVRSGDTIWLYANRTSGGLR